MLAMETGNESSAFESEVVVKPEAEEAEAEDDRVILEPGPGDRDALDTEVCEV